MHTEFPDTVRLDAETKLRLMTLKKRTGIANWNVLCRWAFCLSLADETPVRERNENNVGAVEMTWKTFAGDEELVYRFMLVERCRKEQANVEKDLLSTTLRQHISRGAARLAAAGGIKSVGELLELTRRPGRKAG